MKLLKQFYLVLFLFYINTATAQTTAIPDPNFEQALIDLGIDSDGVVNGQVLTADIENIIELDFEDVFFNETISDLTGIEDFTALEVLNFHYIWVNLEESQSDIFSNNTNLKELTVMNECGDCGGAYIPALDLSGLPNLELINLTNVEIQSIVLNNPDFNLTDLTLNLYHEGFPGDDWTNQICIEVADPQAADANNSPYDTWDIITNTHTTTYFFSSNCTLSSTGFEKKINQIQLYPNPASTQVYLESKLPLQNASIYNIKGQQVLSVKLQEQNSFSVQDLSSGVYFVKIQTQDGKEETKKLIVK